MKRIIIVCSLICVLIFLVVFSSACTPTPTAPVENPFTTQIKSVDAKVTAAEAKIAEFDKILAKLDTRNFVDITAYNAKVADLQAKITALETWKTGLGTANPVVPTNPVIPGTVTGTITTFLDPANPTIIGNSSGYSFIVRFRNTGTATLYVSPELKAKQETGSSATIVSTFTVTTTTANYPATLLFTVVPTLPTTSGMNVIRAIPIGGGFSNNGSIPVFGNSDVIVTFTVALTQSPLTQWNFTINPSVS